MPSATTGEATRRVFELDPELLEVVAPPVGPEPVPRDTRLDARATAQVLEVELPDLNAMLGRLRAQVESSWSLV